LDALVPNLLVRVPATGSKTWMFRSRFPGTVNKRTRRAEPTRRILGVVGVISVEEARDKARAWHALIARGVDPAWQDEQDRLAALREQRNTFVSVAEAYIAHAKREGLRKAKVIEREIRNEFVSRWAARPIADIGPDDLRTVSARAGHRPRPVAHIFAGRTPPLARFAPDLRRDRC
jgi:hypothetical protein